ncbi:MAG: hypothetical protein AABY88_09980 [Pseudomonadota bacterium]
MPALLCGVLVLMLALQFALPTGDELPIEVRRVAPARLAQREVDRVAADPVILRNALFSPGRGGGGGGNVAATGPLDGAAVVGMVRGRGFARAILQQSDGSAVSISVGGNYHGWRLIGLSQGNAIFNKEGERIAMAFTGGRILPNENGFQPRRTNEE